MKRTKRLLSFFLAIVMVITAFAAVPFTSNAADFNGNLTCSAYYYVANHSNDSGRKDKSGYGNSINICNDSGSDNFCSGWWGFSIADLTGNIGTITATLSVEIPEVLSGTTGVDFYATNNSISAKVTNVSGTGTTARDNALAMFPNKVKLGSYTSTSSGTFTASVGDAIKTAKESGWANFNIFAIQSGASASGAPWSDVWCKTPTISVTLTEKGFSDISKENNENSVINRIVLDDAIYTYQSETAYYNYGTVISDLDPWDTQVQFKNGANRADLSSIICVDSNATLDLNGTEKLIGDLVADKFKVSGTKDVYATLKFTFNDGAVEYHRVAVKSYPVENHISVVSEKSPWRGDHTETGYTMFMRGSTGSGGNGVWKYQKSYFTGNTTSHGFPDQNSNTLSADKNAFIFAYADDGEAKSAVSLATYYIDKSCKDTQWAGLGNSELWDGSNYNITIDVIRTKFAYNLGDSSNWSFLIQNAPADNTITRTNSTGMNNTNGTTYGLKFTKNTSVTTSDRNSSPSDTESNVRIALKATSVGYAVIRTNMVVNLFDKSTARTAYYNEVNPENALKETDYTATSFAAYQNALLNLEAYLSNYEDTDTSTKSTNLVNALNTAKSNLVKRGDTQAVLNKLAEYQSVTANQSKYTPSSYNSFLNEQFNSSDANLTAAIQLGRDTYAQRDLTEAQESAYLTSLQNILNILKLRADFTNYNTALDKATNSTTGYLIPYTTSSVSTLPTNTALQKYNGITIYTNQEEIDDSYQNEINTAANALVAANTAVYTDTIDQSTLQAFVSHIATFDKDVYDEGAVNTVKSNINAIYKTVTFNGTDYYSLDVTDQADYDSKLRSFMNSFNSALDEYTVTVPSNVTAKVNGSPVTPTTTSPSKTYTLPYGTNVTFTTNDNALTAWYMDYTSNVTSRGKQFQMHSESFTTKIIGNIEIYAESASASTSCVTIVRQYNQANVSPALDRASYVATGGTYTLPTEPTRVANYNFLGYYVKGTKVTDASVTINADTQIVAMYEYVGADIDVTTYAIDGSSTTTKYAYNANATIDEPSAYAWVEQVGTSDTWRPFYIGTTCTFKVSEPTVLKPVTETEFKAMFTDEAYAPILRQNGAMADEAGRAVINAQRIDYLPADAVIQEFGILVSKTAASDFDLVNNENTVRCKSSQGLDKVQFTIFLKGKGNSVFSYRSYMIYKLADGTIKTVYSNVANYDGTTV